MAANIAEAPSKGLILLMGVTGTGKSYFVGQLLSGHTVVGNGLESCKRAMLQLLALLTWPGTEKMEQIDVRIGDTLVTLLDCPGFDDSSRSDVDILYEIAVPIALQYKMGQELLGAIWLHSVVDNRMRGSTTQAFNIFQDIVGAKSFKNVLLVTTQWGRATTDEERRLAEEREDTLRDRYWAPMIRQGAQMNRFNGTSASAEVLIGQLLGMRRSEVVFQVQRELVDEEKTLGDTVAGARLGPEVDRNVARHSAKVDELDAAIKGSRLPAYEKKKINQEKKEAEVKLGKGKADQAKLKSKPGKWIKEQLGKMNFKQVVSTAASVGSIIFTVANLFGWDPFGFAGMLHGGGAGGAGGASAGSSTCD